MSPLLLSDGIQYTDHGLIGTSVITSGHTWLDMHVLCMYIYIFSSFSSAQMVFTFICIVQMVVCIELYTYTWYRLIYARLPHSLENVVPILVPQFENDPVFYGKTLTFSSKQPLFLDKTLTFQSKMNLHFLR